jgi:hypothetical protein
MSCDLTWRAWLRALEQATLPGEADRLRGLGHQSIQAFTRDTRGAADAEVIAGSPSSRTRKVSTIFPEALPHRHPVSLIPRSSRNY